MILKVNFGSFFSNFVVKHRMSLPESRTIFPSKSMLITIICCVFVSLVSLKDNIPYCGLEGNMISAVFESFTTCERHTSTYDKMIMPAGACPEFIPESCSPDSQQGSVCLLALEFTLDVSSLAFLSGAGE
jgi:hypothetical protein